MESRDRQRIATELGYSETIFIDLPEPGTSTAHARIFTPAVELPFAGHPTVGASWWLRDVGTPIHTLRVPAGIVQVTYEDDLTAVSTRSATTSPVDARQRRIVMSRPALIVDVRNNGGGHVSQLILCGH